MPLNVFLLLAHAQERLLYHLDIAIQALLPVRRSQEQKREKEKKTMADTYKTLSGSVSSRSSRNFLEAFLLRKAGQTAMLTGKHSESFRSRERKSLLDGFLCCKSCCKHDVEKCSICLLASRELIVLHSNDRNNLKSLEKQQQLYI